MIHMYGMSMPNKRFCPMYNGVQGHRVSEGLWSKLELNRYIILATFMLRMNMVGISLLEDTEMHSLVIYGRHNQGSN